MTQPLASIAAAILGLIMGSFANVLIHRLPRHASIAWPGSHCVHCGHALAWWENVPVLSWLALRGRCRACQAGIAWRYPLVELGMAASWAALAWRGPWDWALVGQAVLLFLLLVLAVIDAETGLLPDRLTLPGAGLGVIFSALTGRLADSLIGAACGYGFFWLVGAVFQAMTRREGLGRGDYKLLAMLGAFLGWQALPFIVLLASLSGAVLGSLYLWLRYRHLRRAIPFGPFLAAAGMCWVFVGGMQGMLALVRF